MKGAKLHHPISYNSMPMINYCTKVSNTFTWIALTYCLVGDRELKHPAQTIFQGSVNLCNFIVFTRY